MLVQSWWPSLSGADRFVHFQQGWLSGALLGLVLFPIAGALIASDTVDLSR